MNTPVFLATSRGLVVCEFDKSEWRVVRRGLTEQHVTSVIAREGVILAGTRQGLFCSGDFGETWHEASTGLSIRHVRWLAYYPDISDFELAGTEPAGIYVSRDGSETWRNCPEVGQQRDRYGWFLPYSPEAGCVRGFAHHGQRAYAAVEVGGVLVSNDGGENWELASGSRGDTDLSVPEPFVHPDVHSIAVHPSSPDLVYAPTGGGFYRSFDGGETWERFHRGYCRAVWLDSEDSEHILLGPADGVDRNGRIEESRDGGRTWRPASKNLSTPWRNTMVERFTQIGYMLLAVLSKGELWSCSIEDFQWKRILPEVVGVTTVTEMAD